MTAMTELFYRDPYVREFTSKVTSCVEGEKGFEVMLEDTAFYPEGGGQPADRGTLTLPDGTKASCTTATSRLKSAPK